MVTMEEAKRMSDILELDNPQMQALTIVKLENLENIFKKRLRKIT